MVQLGVKIFWNVQREMGTVYVNKIKIVHRNAKTISSTEYNFHRSRHFPKKRLGGHLIPIWAHYRCCLCASLHQSIGLFGQLEYVEATSCIFTQIFENAPFSFEEKGNWMDLGPHSKLMEQRGVSTGSRLLSNQSWCSTRSVWMVQSEDKIPWVL